MAEYIVRISDEIREDGSQKVEEKKPLVRCKDCIHYRYYGLSNETVSECTIDHCENQDANWYCADGERKEGR